jgi:hypothetical protein
VSATAPPPVVAEDPWPWIGVTLLRALGVPTADAAGGAG